MMKETTITIIVHSIHDIPEEFYLYLNQAVWDFDSEFEDWKIYADGVRKT